MLHTLAVTNYRSLRALVLPLGGLSVVTGANGSGKSSLYRALRLLAATAQGGLVTSLAREGGLPSVVWAGPESIGRAVRAGTHAVEGTVRQGPMQLRLGFAADDYGYAVDLGYPVRKRSAFVLDPEIKRECLWAGPTFRPAALLADRRGAHLRVADEAGRLGTVPGPLSGFESMMTAYADPGGAPEMVALRERIRSWRFYDHLRTDAGAPARLPQVGTHTPVLGDDGADVAAALQTIREIGDAAGLEEAVADAFPGSAVEVLIHDGRFELAMRQHGLLRPLKAAELSDGTLRYLMLVAALLTPRPPELMVLNEPETSLHPDLVPALARLVRAYTAQGQIVVVTHDAGLAAALGGDGAEGIALEKSFGETRRAGDEDPPRWVWPER